MKSIIFPLCFVASAFSDFVSLRISVQERGASWPTLSPTEQADMRNIADQGIGIGRDKARSVLNFFYGADYLTDPELPTPSTALKVPFANTTPAAAAATYIVAFPNPAKDWIVFEYNLPCPAAIGEIIVTDIYGKEILRRKVAGSKNQALVETENWPAGTYLYRLNCDQTAIDNGKVVIIK